MIKEINSFELEKKYDLYQDNYNPKSYFLKKSLHSIHYEVSGNEKGIPVVFVHGGPGSPMGDLAKRFFDKDKYYIIVIDQRACGLSMPFAEIKENTTFDLVSDMEDIRKELNIDKWIVFGGSWGSTLSLIYAINHPDRVLKLVLRGIFLARKEDVDWLFKKGASFFYPKEFEKFISILNEEERKDPLSSYSYYLNLENEISKKYAKNWSDWEKSCIRLIPKENSEEISDSDISMARMEIHYFMNNSFIPENYILDNIDKIENLEVDIVHGRYDVDCRLEGAYLLYNKLNNANLYIINDAGHSSLEVGIKHKLMEIMEEYDGYKTNSY